MGAALEEVAKVALLLTWGSGRARSGDWFVTHGRSEDELVELLEAADPYSEYDLGGDLYVTLADIVETTLRWLGAGRIPAGKLTMLEGDPGLGKSMLWAKIVAHVTTGDPLPGDGVLNDPADVLVICAEDDLNDTITPRLRTGLQEPTSGACIP